MHLTPRELDRLVQHGAGSLARRRLARGEGPTIVARVVDGAGVDEIALRVVAAWGSAT